MNALPPIEELRPRMIPVRKVSPLYDVTVPEPVGLYTEVAGAAPASLLDNSPATSRWLITWGEDDPVDILYDIQGGPVLAFLAKPQFIECATHLHEMTVGFSNGEVVMPTWPDDLRAALAAGPPSEESR